MSRCFTPLLVSAVLIAACSLALSQDSQQSKPRKQPPPQTSEPMPRSEDEQAAPPLTDNESSSKQTQIDISPPKDDAAKHPDSDISDVTEMHPYNPHKAEKDVEVGEFYQKRKNYRGAEDRFREALIFKPGDAIATYRLAEVLDAQGKTAEATEKYEEYLKIPSSGKYAADAKKALARMEQKNSAAKQ